MDPDQDALQYRWFQYREAGSYKGTLTIDHPEAKKVSFTAPAVEKVETLHIILEVTDQGTPSLTRYKRVIVNILSS